MARKYLIFFPFFFVCSLLVLGVLRESGLFGAGELGAGGFGVSPPVLDLGEVLAGEQADGRITLLRNTLGTAETVALSVEDYEMPGWLTLQPGPDLVFGDSDFQLPFRVLVSPPANARPGKYRAAVIARYGRVKTGLLAVGLGARIEVILTVVRPDIKPFYSGAISGLTFNSERANRFHGRFILKTQDKGRLWYVDPRSSQAIYLPDQGQFWQFLQLRGLAVSPSVLSLLQRQILSESEEKIRQQLLLELAGDFLESPEAIGVFWYVEPGVLTLHGFTGPNQAWDLARRFAIGMTNADFNKLIK